VLYKTVIIIIYYYYYHRIPDDPINILPLLFLLRRFPAVN